MEASPLRAAARPAPPLPQNELGESSLQERSELDCCPELRDRLQILEGRSERVGETPDRSRSEFLILRIEVQVMHGAGEVLWSFESAVDERLVDHNLRCDIGEFAPLPYVYLLSHGFEVPLHWIHTHRDAVYEGERLRVFGEHRRDLGKFVGKASLSD